MRISCMALDAASALGVSIWVASLSLDRCVRFYFRGRKRTAAEGQSKKSAVELSTQINHFIICKTIDVTSLALW